MLNAEVEACAREKNVDLPFLHQLLQVEKTGMNDPDVVRAESRLKRINRCTEDGFVGRGLDVVDNRDGDRQGGCRNALSLARLVRGGGQGIDLKR